MAWSMKPLALTLLYPAPTPHRAVKGGHRVTNPIRPDRGPEKPQCRQGNCAEDGGVGGSPHEEMSP